MHRYKQPRSRWRKRGRKPYQEWEKRLWHLSNQAFGCLTDAQNAWEKALKGKPSWVSATFTFKEQKQHPQRGRPKKEAASDQTVWSLVPNLAVDQHEVAVLARKKAAFIVATTILDAQRLAPEQVISTYKEQGGVERGFRFLKDPLVLASSVFVKKPERVIALPLRDGALLVGVSAGRASTASSIGGNGTNRPQSDQ
jgi:transposase